MNELERVEGAYLALLGMPHGEMRVRLQSVLAGLRDTIAWRLKVPSDQVQEYYEEMVR